MEIFVDRLHKFRLGRGIEVVTHLPLDEHNFDSTSDLGSQFKVSGIRGMRKVKSLEGRKDLGKFFRHGRIALTNLATDSLMK